MPIPIRETAASVDLSARIFQTTTVVGSPALAAETIIASLTITGDLAVITGVQLFGWFAATVGTSGVSAQAKIRRTNVSGTTIVDSGATTQAAASLFERGPQGFDAITAVNQQVYVMTLTIASGAATSTVSAVSLVAIVI